MAICVAYTLYYIFFSNTIAFWPWVEASANKWLPPPPHKNEPSVCAPAPVIKIAYVAAPLFSLLGWQWLSRYLVALSTAALRAGNAWRHANCWLLLVQEHADDKVSTPLWHSPPFSSFSAVGSCKGSDVLRLKPAGCCSMHPIFFYLLPYIVIYHQAACLQSSGLGPLCVDSVPISLICLKYSVFHCQMRLWCLYAVIH